MITPEVPGISVPQTLLSRESRSNVSLLGADEYCAAPVGLLRELPGLAADSEGSAH